MRLILFFVFMSIGCFSVHAQKSDSVALMQQKILNAYNTVSSSSLDKLNTTYAKLTANVTSQSQKLLSGMEQKETKLMQQVQELDSNKAKQLFTGVQSKYQQLTTSLQAPLNTGVLHPLKQYIPGLDSIQTAMQFLQQINTKFPGILGSSKLQQISAVGTQIQSLESKLQAANNIQSFIQQREAELKSQLNSYSNLGGQLLGINKQVYYYQAQLQQYKAMLSDKKLLETKALTILSQSSIYQKFMQKNSYFAQIFKLPDNYGTPQSLNGLQTINSVQGDIMQKIGSGTGAGGNNPGQFLQQQFQAAQSQLAALKNKVNQFTGNSGTSGNLTMPDFDPNTQKTKTFLKRLEFGFSIQNEQGTGFLPPASDLALTLGYKISDKATVGFGTAYRLGLGSGFSDINLTNQGFGLRSYVDIKAKGSIWITGGLEYNYYQEFASLHDLENIQNIDIWQKSALAGLTKKYKIGKKVGNLQLLYDFLHEYEIPIAPAFQFRLGYTL